MVLRRNTCFMAVTLILSLIVLTPAHAGTPMSDRVAVEAGVRTEVGKDLALPYRPSEALADRHCLDGSSEGCPG